MNKLSIAAALIACVTSAMAQGTDTCTSPTIVVGTGPFSFDNTTATTGVQGQTEALCTQFATTVLKKDVWFTWNATFSGSAIVTTCGATTVDTKVAVYPGSACPTAGTALGCNDDGCLIALESQTNAFPVTLGQNYVIQVGVYPVGTVSGGIGTFDIQNVVVPTNDNCATPLVVATQGQYAFDTGYASRDLAVGQSETLCLINTSVTPIYRDLWYRYTASTNSVQVKTCDLINGSSPFTDTRIAVYPGSACPAMDTSLNCEDDSFLCVVQGLTTEVTFAATCGATYMIQVGNYNPHAITFGLVEFAELGSPCNTPSTPFCSGDAVGTTCVACGNNGVAGHGCASSGFAGGALLGSSGIASLSADTLVLMGSDLTGPGLFFQSNGLAASPVGFGDGMLCAAVGILRMGVVFPVAGSASYPGGLTPNPVSVAGGPISAGNTKHYQVWYRDAAAFCTASTFNTSNGVSLVWAP